LEPLPIGVRASALHPAGEKPSWGSADAGSKPRQFGYQTRFAPSEMVMMVQGTHGSSRRAPSGYWGDALLRKNTAQRLQMKPWCSVTLPASSLPSSSLILYLLASTQISSQ